MTWAYGQLAPFDCESTAADPAVARLVTATVAHIIPNAETAVASHMVAVDVDIPAAATEVHGITTEQARANGKPLAEVAGAVAGHLTELLSAGVPVVGMNVAYDCTLLDRELARCGLPTLDARMPGGVAPLIDVFVIDKAVDRYRPGKRTLTALCETYGVRLDSAHDATGDALAAARVAYRMCQRAQRALADPRAVADLYADRRYPDRIVRGWQQLGRMTLAELHTAQAGWYAEQSESFAQYLRRQANEVEHQAEWAEDDAERETLLADAAELLRRADDVNTSWPMRPFGGGS